MRKKKFDRFKKILAGIMSATMVLSSMVVAGADTESTTDVIDTTKDVSLTITRKKATGVDTYATVDGITYTLYKIADIVSVTSPETSIEYQITDVSIKSALSDAETIDADADADTIYQTLSSVSALPSGVSGQTGDTSADGNGTGTVKFSSETSAVNKISDQGLYLVVETPNTLKDPYPVEPFFVSLPTTIEMDTVGSEWKYDVNATPKTTLSTGNITIKKYGITAGVTDETQKVPLTDVEFYLQKKNTSDAWELVTSSNGYTFSGDNAIDGVDKDSGVVTISSADGATIKNLEPGEYRFIEKSAPDGYIIDGTKTYNFTIEVTGKASGDAVESASTESGSVISVTNEKPTVEKQVLAKDDDDTYSDTASYNADEKDTVTFRIEATVPTNIDKLKTFNIVDEFDRNQFNKVEDEAVTIKYYNEEGSEIGEESIGSEGTKYNSFTSEDTGWTLEFAVDQLNNATDDDAQRIAKIVVTFTTTLKKTAIVAGEGNINTGKVEYTNHIYPTTNGDIPDVKDSDSEYEERITITDQAGVYTFGFDLEKTFQGASKVAETDSEGNEVKDDEDNTVMIYDGLTATFDLYRTAYSVIEEDAVSNPSGLPAGTYIKIGEYTTDKEGKLSVTGLANSTNKSKYYLVETKTAEGYNLLKNPIEVTIDIDYSKAQFEKTMIVEKLQDNIVQERKTYTEQETTEINSETGDEETVLKKYYTLEKINGSGELEVESANVETTTVAEIRKATDTVYNGGTIVTVAVTNKKGFTFPTTGGRGTIIFTIIGLMLMIGGISIYFTARKRRYS